MFYRELKPLGCASWFRPDKTCAASFLNGFKNIPGKACVKRVHNNPYENLQPDMARIGPDSDHKVIFAA